MLPAILSGIARLSKLTVVTSFFTALFTDLIVYLSKFFSINVATKLAALSAIVAITAFSVSGIEAGLEAIFYISPPYLEQSLSMVIPSNAFACVMFVTTLKTTRWLWTWQIYVIERLTFEG